MTSPRSHHDRHLWQFRWVRDLFVFAVAVSMVWLGHRMAVVTVPLLVALMAAYVCEPIVARLAHRAPWLGRTGSAFALLAGLVIAVAGLVMLVVVPVSIQAVDMAHDAPRQLARIETYLTAEERPAWLRSRIQLLLATVVTEPKAPADADRADDVAANGEPVADPAPAADDGESGDVDPETAADDDEGGDVDPASEPVADPEADGSPDAAAALGHLRGVFDRVLKVVGGTAEAVLAIGLFIGIFLFAFVPLSASFPGVARWLRELMPPEMRRQAAPLLTQMDMIISGFVRGRFITAGILAGIYATGWSLVGVPYAAVVGILTGVASLVPFGAALGLPVTWILVAAAAIGAEEPSLYVVAAGEGFSPIWWRILALPAAVAIIAQLTEDYALNPLIQRKATHLHPLVIMLAVIAGGSLLGPYGMILAVPVVACAKVLLDAVVAPALRRWAEHASTSTET